MASKTNSAQYHADMNKILKLSVGTKLQDFCNELTKQQLHKIAGRTS